MFSCEKDMNIIALNGIKTKKLSSGNKQIARLDFQGYHVTQAEALSLHMEVDGFKGKGAIS
jgi:hypothetical protein